MLHQLEFNRDKAVQQTPCGDAVPSGKIVAFRFADKSLEIWKARNAVGAHRGFCAWSNAWGHVGGKSLQFPRLWLRTPVEVQITPSGRVTVQKHRGRIITRLDDAELHLRSVGLRNHVHVERPDGTVLVDISAVGGVITIEPELLTAQESVLFLHALGSGLIQRARRFGIIPRTLFSSPYD